MTTIIATKSLTPRQREIVVLMGRGFVDKEIAAAMSVSIKTVKTQARLIYDWCGVHNRTHAVLAAIAYGQIKLDDCFECNNADWVVDAYQSASLLMAHLKRAIDAREVRQ